MPSLAAPGRQSNPRLRKSIHSQPRGSIGPHRPVSRPEATRPYVSFKPIRLPLRAIEQKSNCTPAHTRTPLRSMTPSSGPAERGRDKGIRDAETGEFDPARLTEKARQRLDNAPVNRSARYPSSERLGKPLRVAPRRPEHDRGSTASKPPTIAEKIASSGVGKARESNRSASAPWSGRFNSPNRATS